MCIQGTVTYALVKI